MFSRFKRFFAPPIFEDPEKTRRANNLSTILNALTVIIILWAWYPIFVQGGAQIAVALAIFGVLAGMHTLLRRGQIRLLGNLLAFSLWIIVVAFMWIFGGVRNSGFSAIAIIIVIASLTIGARAGFIYALISVIAGITLVVAENEGWLPPYAYEPNTTILTSYSLLFLAVGLLLTLAIGNINKALKESAQATQKTKETLNLLEKSSAELEARTVVLEQQNLALQIVAEVARISAQAKEQDVLLNDIVNLLVKRLKIDHVGIFLADEQYEYVHLVATNSEEGKNLLLEGYKLPVSADTFGWVLSESDALPCQVGKQLYYITKPDSLAESKMNISYPIATASQLIGLINIQAVSPEPLQMDIDTFQVVVTQIALSLENIRLVQQLQQQVQEIRHLVRQTTDNVWKEWEKRKVLGYAYNQIQVLPCQETFPNNVYELLKSGKTASYKTASPKPRSRLVAPVVLRDNVIGVIGYEAENPDHTWHTSEITLLETIASRVSLALENSRLVAEAQQRAEQEQILGQITAKVRETLDIETILQTAVAEMCKSYDLEEAEIRLQAMPEQN